MSGRTLAKNRLHVVSAAQRLPSLATSEIMSVSIQGNGPMPATYATQGLLNKLASSTTSVLTLAKGLLHVIYAAVALARVATATIIRSAVGVRGSRSTRNA